MYDYSYLVKHLRNIYPDYDDRFTQTATLTKIQIPTSGEGEIRLKNVEGLTPSNLKAIYEPNSIFEHGISSIEVITNFNFRIDQYMNGEFKFKESHTGYGTALKVNLIGDNVNQHDFTLNYEPKSKVTITGITDYSEVVLNTLNTTHRLVAYEKDYLILMPLGKEVSNAQNFYSELQENDRTLLTTGHGLNNSTVIDILEVKQFTDDGVLNIQYKNKQEDEYVYTITNIDKYPTTEYLNIVEQTITLGSLIHFISNSDVEFENLDKVLKSNKKIVRDELWLLPLNGRRVNDLETRPELSQTGYTQAQHLSYKNERRFAIIALLATKDQNKQEQASLDAHNTIPKALAKTLVGLDPNILDPTTDKESIKAVSNITLESDSVIVQNRLIYGHEYIFSFVQEITKRFTIESSGTLDKITGGTRALKQTCYELNPDLNNSVILRDLQESEQVESLLNTPNQEVK